jgi:hypothetical protein
MPQAISILIWDQADPWTVRRVAEAIEEYQSVIIPCSSAAAILFTLQHKTVDVVILTLKNRFSISAASEISPTPSRGDFLSPFDDDETRYCMDGNDPPRGV